MKFLFSLKIEETCTLTTFVEQKLSLRVKKLRNFALFYFVCEGNFPGTSPWGAYIWRGDLTEGFSRYRFGGLIFGGAYTRRGLFSEFYGILSRLLNIEC